MDNNEHIDEKEFQEYKQYKLYEKYAVEFFKNICSEHKVKEFANLNSDIIPIKFYKARDERNVEGYTLFKNNQSEIRIFLVDANGKQFDRIDIELAMRHEIIHYALMMCEYNCDDDSAVFHILCDFYDAYSYMEMPESERLLYEKFYYMMENSAHTNVEGWLNEIGAFKDLELLVNKKIDLLKTVNAHKDLFEKQYNATKNLVEMKQKFIEKYPDRKDEINKLLN